MKSNTKITIKKLEGRYYKRIPKKFRVPLQQYIDNEYVQEVLKKAWNYELTDEDNREVYRRGRQGGEFSGLYYISFIYIHPLTLAKAICDMADRL